MSIDPNYPPPAYPAGPGTNPMPPAKAGTNGLAIAGLILSFLIAPIGFILSIVGLVQAGRGNQKGKGLAITGIIVSLALMVGGGVLIAAVGNKVSTLADPGCATGQAAINDNADKLSDPASMKAGIQATIDGLAAAVAKSKHDNVRNALQALGDDYTKLQQTLNGGTEMPAGLQDKMTKDAQAMDSLCTITGGK